MNQNANMIPNLTVGGSRTFTDLANLIVLNGVTGSAANNCAPRKSNGTAGYQVPASKTFRVACMEVVIITGAATSTVSLGYQDVDIGLNVATAPTNPVYVGGNLSAAITDIQTAGTKYFFTDFFVPTGKYLLVQASGSTILSVRIFGYEV